jgi:hypothetical protein
MSSSSSSGSALGSGSGVHGDEDDLIGWSHGRFSEISEEHLRCREGAAHADVAGVDISINYPSRVDFLPLRV